MARFFTDGSSTISVKSAYVVTDESGKIIEFQETSPLSSNTTKDFFSNNEEEYRGVIAALNICDTGDEICTDSLLVVNQVSGRFKIKALHLRELCEQARELIGRKQAKLTWISRDDNKAGKHFE